MRVQISFAIHGGQVPEIFECEQCTAKLELLFNVHKWVIRFNNIQKEQSKLKLVRTPVFKRSMEAIQALKRAKKGSQNTYDQFERGQIEKVIYLWQFKFEWY